MVFHSPFFQIGKSNIAIKEINYNEIEISFLGNNTPSKSPMNKNIDDEIISKVDKAIYSFEKQKIISHGFPHFENFSKSH